MTIHFSEAQEQFIHSLIEKGRFASADNVIGEALRLLEESDRKNVEGRKRIEALLIEGLDSGLPTPMTATDWDEIKQLNRSDFQATGLPAWPLFSLRG